jgi:hypothetical protein
MHPPRAQHGVLTCCKSWCSRDGVGGGAQLPQVAGIDIGNGPEFQARLCVQAIRLYPSCLEAAGAGP